MKTNCVVCSKKYTLKEVYKLSNPKIDKALCIKHAKKLMKQMDLKRRENERNQKDYESNKAQHK